MGKYISVAIDGPAGAGKSTMAKRVAKELGYLYVDTGAIYRTVGYHKWMMRIGHEYLLDMQRKFSRKHNVVMDGRDIGTVVLPNAQVKIFLTASPEERAKRRYEELTQKGEKVSYEKVLQDMIARDKQDSERAIAPLKPAPDAVKLDTSGNTIEQSIAEILAIVRRKLG